MPERELATALPGSTRLARLANGLTVVLVELPQAPLVATCLWYRAGSRDEPAGREGLAHFLEHMMFKGSERYGPGEIDRLTQRLGGANNAFTSHDATVYTFQLAADRWWEALAPEADRMRGLRLDEREIEAERGVILEEISMCQDDPWDRLEEEVRAALFGGHPYGHPILGRREEVSAIAREHLAAFHRRFYTPSNAVLVVAGAPGEGALEVVERHLGNLPGAGAPERRTQAPAYPRKPVRVERRHGRTPRLLLALPAPAAGHPDHPVSKLISVLLAAGRTSRLHHELVEERRLCSWVSAEVFEGIEGGALLVALELLAETDPDELEGRLLAELSRLVEEPVGARELERARRLVRADWAFGHERIQNVGLTLGYAASYFDPDFPARQLDRLLSLGAGELQAFADRWLRPERGAVVGRSLPAEESNARRSPRWETTSPA